MGRKRDCYISVDVEADGPVPGRYSMLSIGMCVAGRSDGRTFEEADPFDQIFEAELRPISEEFVPEALAVSGLDRDRLLAEGEDPAQATTRAAQWCRDVAGPDRPVFAAFPLGFDWMFAHWYFTVFTDGGSPFGHSSHLDLKTAYAVRAGTTIGRATKSQMPAELLGTHPHTHRALDDAIGQAQQLARLLSWSGPA